ncbi:alpha/beta hydrolase family protein [Nocardioides cheoyonin]|uniref:alpha/beta hydrolase family protein n=1 Tax=Nocardioides cheoyonin TaxID=3156615 RepID=UPI0032B4F253
MSTPPSPYGAWPSPISARDVFATSTASASPITDGADVYWTEARPADAGRLTLVRRRAGATEDVSLPGHNVRSRLHEYGGGSHAAADGLVLYVEFATQQVWRVAPGEEPRPITPPSDGLVRLAAFAIDHRRGVAYCVREDQRDTALEPVTSLVRISLDGPNHDLGTVLVAGRERPRALTSDEQADVESPPDFVLDPALSPDGARLAWVTWNHPNMPWDGSWLRVGELDAAGDLVSHRLVAGAEDAAVEPAVWLDDHRITFVSHESGWGNHVVADLTADLVVRAHAEEVDYGAPRWQAGMSAYAGLPDGRIATVRVVDGADELALLDPATGEATQVPTSATAIAGLHVVDAGHVVAHTGRPDAPATVSLIDLADGTTTPLAPAEDDPDPAWVSLPTSVWWDSPAGEPTQGFLYPPANPDMVPPEGARPPLIVSLHGGPSGRATPVYTAQRAYWTSRGFAVLDVNYGGSTGFGTAYRCRLEGQWGVVDVRDAVAGVRHLADAGLIDPERTVIRGGSAGGFSVLAALTSSDVFRAGASYFGISDLVTLVEDTHKFESRYPQRLIAPWPEGREVYVERSPLTHVDRLAVPLILLQGDDDRVVPPAQAELMARVLRDKGLPHELVMYAGEGHGFRDPATNIDALERELAFYQRVFRLVSDVSPAGS